MWFDPINRQVLDSMKTLDLETNEWRMQAKSLFSQHNIAIVAIVVFIYNNNKKTIVIGFNCSGANVESPKKRSCMRLHKVRT